MVEQSHMYNSSSPKTLDAASNSERYYACRRQESIRDNDSHYERKIAAEARHHQAQRDCQQPAAAAVRSISLATWCHIIHEQQQRSYWWCTGCVPRTVVAQASTCV